MDRNQRIAKPFREQFVALRKESVDRNLITLGGSGVGNWVALRKESVDRNTLLTPLITLLISRSPQGERG